MTTEKIAITVPKDVLRRARQAVKAGAATSLSAYISRIIDEKTRRDDFDAMLEEMLAETGGPLTPKEIEWADRQLGLAPKRAKAAKSRKAETPMHARKRRSA
jgi:hypothetical protein